MRKIFENPFIKCISKSVSYATSAIKKKNKVKYHGRVTLTGNLTRGNIGYQQQTEGETNE